MKSQGYASAKLLSFGGGLLSMAIVLMMGSVAWGKVPQSQANRLGNDLTPMGSERAGSKDGSIPAWRGGLKSIPSGIGWTQGSGPHADPFASDRPMMTIDKSNMSQHAKYLTEGQQAMLGLYDTYKMPVYKSRRSCALPSFVYEANKNNAMVSELASGGNGVTGGIMGSPFPIPNNALEIIWNTTLRYRAFKVTRQWAAVPVTRSGDYTLSTVQDEAILQWSDPQKTKAEDLDNISIYYISNTIAPARSAGSVILVHETLNRALDPRKAWQYSPGTRRVRRAPNIAYDNPGTNTDALSTSDSFNGYNGAPDRYDWKVVGKQEKYVAQNNYQLASAKYEDLLQPLHVNQDKNRYERRRVWVVEANLKPSTRHVYARRVKYIEEDSWTIVAADLYDGRGELWRVQEIPMVTFYEVPLCGSAGELVYDLQAGRYLALVLRNEEKATNYFADDLDKNRYTPAAIRRLGIR